MLKAAAIEDRFLNACNETEPEMFGNLSDLAEEGQVEHKFVVLARPQIFEELIDNEENNYSVLREMQRKAKMGAQKRNLAATNSKQQSSTNLVQQTQKDGPLESTNMV